MKEEKKVFVRKATGLVREIGVLTGIVIVMAHVVGLGWQKRVFQTIGWMPIKEVFPPPLTYMFLIVGVIVVFNVYCWSTLSAAMPRAGGAYVYVSRVLGATWGFIAGWSMFVADVIVYGVIAAAGIEAAWLFSILGGIEIELTASLIVWTGLVIVALFAIVAILGTRPLLYFLHIIFWIPVVVTIIVYIIFLTVTPAQMETGVQAIFGVSSATITRAALDQGMVAAGAGYGLWDAIMLSAVGGYWAYIGYAATGFVGGEVKEAYKSMPKILFTAAVIIILFYTTLPTLGARACMMVGKVPEAPGYSFLSSWSFLTYGRGGSLSAAGLPGIRAWIPIAAGIGAKGMGLSWLMPVLMWFGILWPLNDIPPFILVTSRLLFSFAFDRVMPEGLASISERFYSPVKAIITVAVIGVIGVLAESEIFAPAPWGIDVPWLFQLLNSNWGVAAPDVWDVITMFFVSLSAIALVYRRKDIWEKAPFKHSIGGIPLPAICGVIALLGNVWLITVFLTNPRSWLNPTHDYGRVSVGVTFGAIIIGLLIFWYYRYVKGKAIGVDYKTIYAEIPPE